MAHKYQPGDLVVPSESCSQDIVDQFDGRVGTVSHYQQYWGYVVGFSDDTTIKHLSARDIVTAESKSANEVRIARLQERLEVVRQEEESLVAKIQLMQDYPNLEITDSLLAAYTKLDGFFSSTTEQLLAAASVSGLELDSEDLFGAKEAEVVPESTDALKELKASLGAEDVIMA